MYSMSYYFALKLKLFKHVLGSAAATLHTSPTYIKLTLKHSKHKQTHTRRDRQTRFWRNNGMQMCCNHPKLGIPKGKWASRENKHISLIWTKRFSKSMCVFVCTCKRKEMFLGLCCFALLKFLLRELLSFILRTNCVLMWYIPAGSRGW